MIKIYNNNKIIGRVTESKDLFKRFLILAFILAVFVSTSYLPSDKIQADNLTGSITPKTQENATQSNTEPNNRAQVLPEILPSVEIPAGDLFDKYFKDQAVTMRAICQAENGTQDPKRISKPNKNGTLDYGLCQINTIHLWRVGGDYTKLLDAETNLRVAKEIFDDRSRYDDGFNAWTTYLHGKHKKFLK
jgi:hypothetical protein